MTITDEQRGDMLHALGLPETGRVPKNRRRHRIYRNYYNIDFDSPSGKSWQDLEAKGFAIHRPSPTCVGSTNFFVTMAGVEFLGVKHLIDDSLGVRIPEATK